MVNRLLIVNSPTVGIPERIAVNLIGMDMCVETAVYKKEVVKMSVEEVEYLSRELEKRTKERTRAYLVGLFWGAWLGFCVGWVISSYL